MKLVRFLLVLAGAMASVASAHADSTLNTGTLSTTPYVHTSTVIAGTVFTLLPTGATLYNFTDTYKFSVVGVPTTAGMSVDLDLGNLGFHISNLKLDLFSGSTWLAGDWVTGSNDVSVSVNSVPAAEAETYGMMLGGMGLVGFMVSRRRGTL